MCECYTFHAICPQPQSDVIVFRFLSLSLSLSLSKHMQLCCLTWVSPKLKNCIWSYVCIYIYMYVERVVVFGLPKLTAYLKVTSCMYFVKVSM